MCEAHPKPIVTYVLQILLTLFNLVDTRPAENPTNSIVQRCELRSSTKHLCP